MIRPRPEAASTPEDLYHGGILAGQSDPFAAGLWATDDAVAAAEYAAMWSGGTVHRIHVPAGARIVSLREAVDAELASRIEQGEPQRLSASVDSCSLAERLVSQGVWAVYVETGDCHPDTGRGHRSWWIVAPGWLARET
jgi:hypothetical protein